MKNGNVEMTLGSQIILWVFILGAGFLFYQIWDDRDLPANVKNRAVEARRAELAQQKIEAVIDCQQRIRTLLKAPSTAEFPRFTDAIASSGGVFTVSSYVDAQNSFGAKIRTTFTCQLRREANGWIATNLQMQK